MDTSNMTQEELACYALQGMISKLPEEEQGKIAEAKQKIDDVVREYGDMGSMAMMVYAIEDQKKNG